MSRTYRNHPNGFWVKAKRKGKDTKPYNKPNRSWKDMTKEIRRAKEHQAMRMQQFEAFPLFKKYNEMYYT
jgi:hypothetical protein